MRSGTVIWRVVRAIALAGMVVLVAGVFWPTSAPSGTIAYALDWDTDRVVSTVDGIRIDNDLGYSVTLTEATVSSWSTTTVACEHSHGFSIWDSASGLVESSFGVTSAWAGHGDTDQAELVAPTLENLIDAADLAVATSTVLGEVPVSEPSWCEGHWALSGSSGAEQAGAADRDPTLVLSGAVAHPDGTVSTLAISTDMAWGTKTELVGVNGTAVEPETGDPITIAVVRRLGSIFDGIDFATFDSTDLDGTGDGDSVALLILRNLDANTSFVVDAASTGSG